MSPSRRRAASPAVAHRRGARLGIPRPCPRPVAALHARVPLRAHPSCPVAVGRDVPIAPPRHIARGGSPPRCVAWQVAHVESFAGASPCAPHSRAERGVRSTTRGTAAGPNLYALPLHPRITRAARWSAAGPPGSRPTAITPAQFARPRAPSPRTLSPHRPRWLTAPPRSPSPRSPPLCSYSFIVMVFVFLCVPFLCGLASRTPPPRSLSHRAPPTAPRRAPTAHCPRWLTARPVAQIEQKRIMEREKPTYENHHHWRRGVRTCRRRIFRPRTSPRKTSRSRS